MAANPSSLHLLEGTFLNVKSFGAKGDGRTDDHAAIQRCIDAATERTPLDISVPGYAFFTDVWGGIVYFPRGYYQISQKLEGRDRVALVGAAESASYIIPTDSLSDTEMIHYVDGTNAMFGCYLKDIRFHALSNSNITYVIRAEAWQEYCGCIRVVTGGFNAATSGMLIEQGYGGAARTLIIDSGIGAEGAYGIHLESNLPNAYMLGVYQSNVGGNTAGIFQENGRLHVSDLHYEKAGDAIQLAGGNAIIDNVTGAGGVDSIIHMTSGFNGAVESRMLEPNGATVVIDDDVTGFNITTGTVREYKGPSRRTFSANDATPSVASAAPSYMTANSSATTITQFDFIRPLQRFLLIINDANTTIDINGNANFSRKDGTDTDLTPASGDIIECVHYDGVTYFDQFSPS